MYLKHLIAIIAVFTSAISYSQWTPGRYMRQAATRSLATAVVLIRDHETLGIATGSCFLGALLKPSGGYAEITIYLNSSTSYAFVGGGDDDVTDIDISVKNSNGTVVASDTRDDNYPIVVYRPTYSGNYTVVLSNHTRSLAFCALTILQEGGFVLRTQNISDAINRTFSFCDNLAAREKIAFHDYTNQWCFHGYYLKDQQSQLISNISMGYETHYFLSAGDYRSSDIDLCLTNGNGTTEIKCDIKDDATPIIYYKTSSFTTYGLRVKNTKSTGNSFVLTAILTAR